jgi:hypothetical protein
MIRIGDALQSLKSGAEWILRGDNYEGLEWLDKTQTPPTKEEVEAEIARLQKEWEQTQYQRDRKQEYPSIEEQLDLLYHEGYDGWKEKITEVKNKYPKP